jgi:hypothetical protein
MLLFLLAGCATTFSEGDCVEYFIAYKYGKEAAIKPNGEKTHHMAVIKEGKRKIECPR